MINSFLFYMTLRQGLPLLLRYGTLCLYFLIYILLLNNLLCSIFNFCYSGRCIIMEFHFDVCGEDYSLAGSASSMIKKKLNQLGLPALIVRKTAIVMYEAEINMVIHAGGGNVYVHITPEYIEIVLKDEGPGIPDINKAMEVGYSTASDRARELGFGAGMGLPNIQKNSDSLRIDSRVGEGTTVTIVVKLK